MLLTTIVAAVVVFGVLVTVHELGHFATAKLTGMRVDEFAIGFGPKVISHKFGETVYSIRAIPLGGFNDIAGMDPENNDAGERGYCEKSIPRRMLVIVAGSAMNLILPIFIFFGVAYFAGVSQPVNEPVFGTVIPGKAAAQAGLQEGDRVLSIDGRPIATWTEFVNDIKDTPANESIQLTMQRGADTFTTEVHPAYDSQTKRAMIGVTSSVKTTYPGLLESAGLAVQRTGYIIYMMCDALYRIVLELSGADLAGPVGVAQMAGEVAQMGIVPLLNFAAFLSLNLGIVNMFPIPALDGGHFFMLCLEALRGKPLKPETMEYLAKGGIALLVLITLFATKNDIVRIFMGG